MKLITGNILDFIDRVDSIFITTNGFCKSNGECVMGRGIAKSMSNRFPMLPKILGDAIRTNGNVVNYLDTIGKTSIYSFPVKPINVINDGNNVVNHAKNNFQVGDLVPGFYAKASLEIIEKSCRQLLLLNHKYFLLPIVGCGAGELKYKKDVEPLMLKYFDDKPNIYLCSFKKEDFYK